MRLLTFETVLKPACWRAGKLAHIQEHIQCFSKHMQILHQQWRSCACRSRVYCPQHACRINRWESELRLHNTQTHIRHTCIMWCIVVDYSLIPILFFYIFSRMSHLRTNPPVRLYDLLIFAMHFININLKFNIFFSCARRCATAYGYRMCLLLCVAVTFNFVCVSRFYRMVWSIAPTVSCKRYDCTAQNIGLCQTLPAPKLILLHFYM